MTDWTDERDGDPPPSERDIVRPWAKGCLMVGAVVVAAVVLLNLRPWSMPLYEDDARTLAEVRRLVPVGSDVAYARKRMERNGFACRIYEDLPSTEYEEPHRLYCSQDRLINRWRVPFFSYTWRIWFLLEGDEVTGTGMTSGMNAL